MRLKVIAGYGVLVLAFAYGVIQWVYRAIDRAVARSFKEEACQD